MTEDVLVVPRDRLFVRGSPPLHGFQYGGAEECLRIADEAGRFLSRDLVESDPSLKQIIPYAVLVHRDSVFLMRRSARGGEARLHRKASLGVGGHVNPGDLDPPGASGPGALRRAVERAFRRELDEEVELDARHSVELLGILNDDSSPVGSVHIGLVYRVDLEVPRARVRAAELAEGAFVPVGELPRHRDDLETWSWFLAEAMWPARPPT